MPYGIDWSATNPGCLILLVDRSGSMGETFGGRSVAVGQALKDQVATIVNNTIRKLALASRKGTEIRPRVDVAILGYGNKVVASALPTSIAGREHELVKISDLDTARLRTDIRKERKFNSETGEFDEYNLEFPIWVEPIADGDTPMCAALEKATAIATSWTARHRSNHPPVIINLTDGEATDGDPRRPAEALKAVETDDGKALLFNCHISPRPSSEVRYPVDESELPTDNFAPVLFAMSSELPDKMQVLAVEKLPEANVRPGSRGFVFNADASDIVNMITIATVAGGMNR